MRVFHNFITTKTTAAHTLTTAAHILTTTAHTLTTTAHTLTTTQQISDISTTESENYFRQHRSSSQNRASLGIKTT
jgi:hypothetical protein